TPASDRSTAITIRLADLVIDDSQPASSAVRFDALICTRSVRGAGFATWTWRHPASDGGADLDAAGAVLFQGDVHDFVDIFLWASEDQNSSLELEQLLAQRGDRAVIEDAIHALSWSSCAPRVVAVAASAALAQLSEEVLVAATQQCSGLYR